MKQWQACHERHVPNTSGDELKLKTIVILARTSSMCVQLSSSRGRNQARLDLSSLANTVDDDSKHTLSNEREIFVFPHCRQTKRTGVGETSYF